jgi:hypothetical protein
VAAWEAEGHELEETGAELERLQQVGAALQLVRGLIPGGKSRVCASR